MTLHHSIGAADGAARATVRRRQVFYIAGFDPFGPRRYRELHRREGARQAEISGYRFLLRGVEGDPRRWRTKLVDRGRTTEAEIEFLGWDDLVRGAIRPSLWRIYGLMLRTLWLYGRSGAIRAMAKLSRGPLIAGLVPVAVMLFYLLYAGLAGGAAAVLAGQVGAPMVLSAGLGLLVATAVMMATWAFEEQAMVYFMVNDLGANAAADGAYPPALDARLTEFAERIAAAMEDPALDEVLVVGHSSGAQLAVTALARARRQSAEPASLLTLGQSIAMLSFLPRATELRADLARIADDPQIFWLDVTAPADGASFALTDPVATCRARGRVGESPLVISAAFSDTMDAARLARDRWRFLTLHFQYLCAFERPGAFDYFQITGGGRSLAARFAGRRSSPSLRAEPVAPMVHPG